MWKQLRTERAEAKKTVDEVSVFKGVNIEQQQEGTPKFS